VPSTLRRTKNREINTEIGSAVPTYAAQATAENTPPFQANNAHVHKPAPPHIINAHPLRAHRYIRQRNTVSNPRRTPPNSLGSRKLGEKCPHRLGLRASWHAPCTSDSLVHKPATKMNATKGRQRTMPTQHHTVSPHPLEKTMYVRSPNVRRGENGTSLTRSEQASPTHPRGACLHTRTRPMNKRLPAQGHTLSKWS